MPDPRFGSVDGPLSDSLVHELKTSLSMIVGFAELLETREDPDTRSEATRGIVQAATRLRATIDSMLGHDLDDSLDDGPDLAPLPRRTVATG